MTDLKIGPASPSLEDLKVSNHGCNPWTASTTKPHNSGGVQFHQKNDGPTDWTHIPKSGGLEYK
ncbi:hypothetical protein KIH41_03935 [Litoribacter ruber]|uniref:hypothetical protein n=1 Tax=Litoribacter ruber TaxID=702568 RepID=UPI001BD9EC7D|nr:hypothetical protein [Litoribacter ruber]MBT0810425.1 hypothetical protein [Litoribacter ruber]